MTDARQRLQSDGERWATTGTFNFVGHDSTEIEIGEIEKGAPNRWSKAFLAWERSVITQGIRGYQVVKQRKHDSLFQTRTDKLQGDAVEVREFPFPDTWEDIWEKVVTITSRRVRVKRRQVSASCLSSFPPLLKPIISSKGTSNERQQN